MSSSKSLALLKLSLSPPTISLLHTLHTEFNTFISQTSQQTQQATQSTPKEILEGIFQVVAWDLKTQITHEEFSVLFTEWSKAKGSLLTASRLFDMTQRNQFPIDQMVLALKNTVAEIRDFHGFLTKTIELFSYEFDSFLYRTEEIGCNYEGVRVGPADQDSISLMNEIFKTFDQKEQGHLTLDGLFFLYIALQEKENKALIKDFDEEETFCTELNDRFKDFLIRIKCFQGRITALQAKSYLLYNNIASKSDLNSLRKSVRNTTEMALELNENVLHEYGGLLPDLLQIAIKKAFPSLNLIEINKNPTDLQILYHFLLVRFYPYVHEQDYFEGLFISNKTLLAQMMLKEARKYYGDEIFRTINWSFDPTQGFLSVISAYNELVDQVLRFYFQFKGRESKESLFTGRSARGNYFHDTLNLSKDTINTSIQDYSQRHSRSMFTGRSNDNQISFRDPMEKEDTSNRYQIKMKGPPSLNINKPKQPVTVMRLLTRGVSENAKKEKENSHHYYKATQSSEKKKSTTPRKQEISFTNNKNKRDTSNENKRELFQVGTGTPTKKNVAVPARNPQSIRKALDEVDTNYAKKIMPKEEKVVSKLRREKSQEIEPVNKSVNGGQKTSRREEDMPSTVRLNSSINKGSNQANQIQEHQQKIMSIASSKPPLKRQNSSKKVLIVDEGSHTYESFNPSYYEKSMQLIEPDQEKGEENITPELTRREPVTTADESFANDKSHIEPTNRSASIGHDVSKMRTQNQQAWQQEKNILEQLTKRRGSHNGLEDKAKNSSFSVNISEIRKGSLASQQDQAIKSMRNHDIMDILTKLDTKISEGKHPGINKPNESFTSSTSQSEQKMSMHARNSVEAATMNKSIMDIMKDHIEKEKAQGQTLRTRSDAEEEPKKEFYLNLKEIISETKREKSSHSPIKKPNETKVFSMSIAEHVRVSQNRKENEKLLAKANMGSPPTEINSTLRESETLKSSVEKNKQIQELVGLKKSNSLTVKSRQNSSKSPAKVKNVRVAKTESFEVVMERLKKGPGNTPTKGKSSKKAF